MDGTYRQVLTATTAIENRKRRHNFPQIEWLIGEMVGKGSLPLWGLLGVLRKQSMRITSTGCKDPGTGGRLTFRLNVVDHPPDREDVYLSHGNGEKTSDPVLEGYTGTNGLLIPSLYETLCHTRARAVFDRFHGVNIRSRASLIRISRRKIERQPASRSANCQPPASTSPSAPCAFSTP